MEIKIEKDILGGFEVFEIDGQTADVNDFGTVETSGDCSSGVCKIVRRFVPGGYTNHVNLKYGIDRNGYDEVCEKIAEAF